MRKFRIVSACSGRSLGGLHHIDFPGHGSGRIQERQTIPSKVVDDQVAQYNFAVKSGTLTDRCVQAGFVASAYIQVKDEPNREEWERIRQDDCKAAGLPH